MASMTAQEMPLEQQMFGEVWNLYKKYRVPEADSNDSYWSGLVNEADAIAAKYDSYLCSKMVVAIESSLVRDHKSKEGI